MQGAKPNKTKRNNDERKKRKRSSATSHATHTQHTQHTMHTMHTMHTEAELGTAAKTIAPLRTDTRHVTAYLPAGHANIWPVSQ